MTNEEAIKELRDASDNEVRYGDTEHHYNEVMKRIEALDMAIKALEQQPCEDAISRQAVINRIANTCFWLSDNNWEELIKCINSISPVTPQQKIGHWMLLDECSNSGYYCSECHKKVIKEGWSDTVKKVKYCPNCGARMAESEEDNGRKDNDI